VALDIQDPERVGYAVARRVSGSRVPHVRASVYDLEKLGLRDFDHIVFKGVFYHLKHPILAFEQIAKALKVGGRVSIEGETPLNHVEDIDGKKVDLDLRRLNELRVPACFSYPNRFKDGSNWFIPNLACMESWLRACGLKVVSMKTWESDAPPFGGQRLIGVAERVAQHVGEIEHPLY
jgi:tRNA (mo5U34)-methyltransferase